MKLLKEKDGKLNELEGKLKLSLKEKESTQ
jgi:hypothetical protein